MTDKGLGVGRLALWMASTAGALVLLLSWHTSTGSRATPVTVTGTTSGTGQTYAGSVAQTRWGPVQVQITVQDGEVTAASVLRVPDGNHRDVEINSYAVPILNEEAVSADSAEIDAVSGATVTSHGYITSLQAALDAAGLA